jgi:hypothetical protein
VHLDVFAPMLEACTFLMVPGNYLASWSVREEMSTGERTGIAHFD